MSISVAKMIHTYKRKRASLQSCSFYERLFGDSLAECSALTKLVEDVNPNGCCSRETDEAKCEALFDGNVSKNSVVLQSPPWERFEAPPIKFKYTRRRKALCSTCSSIQRVAALQLVQEANQRISEVNRIRSGSDNTGCNSCQRRLSLVNQNHGIPDNDNSPYFGNPYPGNPDEITDKCLDALENAGSLCYDSCSFSHSIDLATIDTRQPNSGSPNLNQCCGGSFSSQIFNKGDYALDRDCNNITSKRYSESDCAVGSLMLNPDFKGRDGADVSSNQNCHEIVKTKCTAPLFTYSRRSRKDEDTHRTYAHLLSERDNFSVSDQNISGRIGSHAHKAMSKIIDHSNSEAVPESSPPFSSSLDRLDAGVSAFNAMISDPGNRKVRNGCRLTGNANASEIPSLNEEAVTGQQPDDAIKPHHNICDLSLHSAYEKASTAVAMQDTFMSVLENSQNHSNEQEKAGVASKDFSDKPGDVEGNLTASIECREEAATLQSKSHQHCVERNHVTSSHEESPKTSQKELLETMEGAVTGTNGLPDINIEPSKETGLVSQKNEMVNSVALPNGSTQSKVLQLFPEDITDHAHLHSTSNSGPVPAVISNNSSVTMGLPDLSIGSPEFTQDTIFEPSSSQAQARRKLLLDSIRSWKPTTEAIDGFYQNFQPFTAFWSEEELDNLWVGVRRHGKDNWYELLKDPKLRFAPWRTARDLSEKWIMEQTKLLGITPAPQLQSAKPIRLPFDNSYRSAVPQFMPPDPGFMTRFLTDPTQLSLSNAYLTNPCQGLFPPRPPHNFPNAPGNRTRQFSHRVKAHRRSQHAEKNSWERFKARNQIMSPPLLPTPVPTTSRNDVLSYPHPLPPLPIPSLSIPHSGNPSQFHVQSNNNGLNSRRNVIHSPNATTADCPNLALPKSQSSAANASDLKRPRELVNLGSDASSEETLSDDDTRTVCK